MDQQRYTDPHHADGGKVGHIERMGQQCRATGNHRVAQNDEPEPGDLTPTDLAAIDAEFPPGKPFSEEWFAQADRIHEQRKDSGEIDRERVERAHWSEVQRRPNSGFQS